jgi:hypothetical protein
MLAAAAVAVTVSRPERAGKAVAAQDHQQPLRLHRVA